MSSDVKSLKRVILLLREGEYQESTFGEPHHWEFYGVEGVDTIEGNILRIVSQGGKVELVSWDIIKMVTVLP